ncbi:MAG: hypothetical protein ACYYK0_08015 [Candidatus Eutrophobiaceae bacterium]
MVETHQDERTGVSSLIKNRRTSQDFLSATASRVVETHQDELTEVSLLKMNRQTSQDFFRMKALFSALSLLLVKDDL